jgi:hypothetical protein
MHLDFIYRIQTTEFILNIHDLVYHKNGNSLTFFLNYYYYYYYYFTYQTYINY